MSGGQMIDMNDPLPKITIYTTVTKQKGLAVASIVRDDPSTLPGDDPFLAPACTTTRMRGKLGSEFET